MLQASSVEGGSFSSRMYVFIFILSSGVTQELRLEILFEVRYKSGALTIFDRMYVLIYRNHNDLF